MDVAGSLLQKCSAELTSIQLMPNLQEAYGSEYVSLFLPYVFAPLRLTPSSTLLYLSKNVLEDATIAEVVDFDRSIQASSDLEALFTSVFRLRVYVKDLSRRKLV